MNLEFKDYLQRLVNASQIVIDRPKGSTHPRYPGKEYPVDYGFLDGTTSTDSSGVDVWVGSLGKDFVVGVLCTVDLVKKDTELKILVGCSEDDIERIMEFVNDNQMRAIQINL